MDERKHCHIVEIGLTLLFQATSQANWVGAFLTTCFWINRMSFTTLKIETPFFKLFNRHSDYGSLNVSGCKCFPYLRDYGKNTFPKKTYPCVFLGYSPIHEGYRCLDLSTNKVWISRHDVFDEIIFPYSHLKQMYIKENLEVMTFPDSDAWRKKEIDFTIQKGSAQREHTTKPRQKHGDLLNHYSQSKEHRLFYPLLNEIN